MTEGLSGVLMSSSGMLAEKIKETVKTQLLDIYQSVTKDMLSRDGTIPSVRICFNLGWKNNDFKSS